MKSRIILWGCCLCLVCIGAFAAVPPPDAPSELNWTRRSVTFSHQAHFTGLGTETTPQASCALCHHPVNGETPFLTCAAPDCHDNLNAKDKSVRSYHQAIHKKKKDSFHSCLSCHEERSGADPAQKKRLAGCKQSVCHP